MSSSRKPPSGGQGAFDFGQRQPPPLELREAELSSEPPEVRPPEAKPALERPAPVEAKAAEPRVWNVSELVRAAGRLLEARFGLVWVEGEISNLSAPRSGHLYFTLVDKEGQLPAVMFRAQAERLRFRVTDGLKVRARGRLSIYEGGGKFQMYVDALEPAGLGARELAFLQLKEKLQKEGLFDQAKKRPLPRFPKVVGIATSPTGAAIRDVLRIAERRGRVRFLLAPCQVQGDSAPFELARAIRLLEERPEVEVIIVGRGGGSAEDLAAFNDETLARVIAGCRVPVVSAVGHEVDFTIADFVADQRAPTPSAAAELVVPLWSEWRGRIDEVEARVVRAGRRAIAEARQRLEQAEQRASAAVHRELSRRRRLLSDQENRLAGLHPRARLSRDRGELQRLGDRLERRVHALVAGERRQLAELAGRLQGLSPLGALERGYSLTRTMAGHVVTRAEEVRAGDRLEVTLSQGSLAVTVDESRPAPTSPSSPSADEGEKSDVAPAPASGEDRG